MNGDQSRRRLNEILWPNLPRHQRPIPGRILSTLIVGFLLFCSGNALAMSKFNFDPTECRSDAAGKFYVALGATVLALSPPVGGILIDDVGVVRRAPPDPKQPIGCPDNPMQVRSYESGVSVEPNSENDPHPEFSEGVSDFTLYDVTPRNSPQEHNSGKWSAEETIREFVDHICSEATKREDLSVGLNVCLFQQASTQVHIEDWLAGYKARLDTYQTPLGHVFAFSCGGNLYSVGFGHCHVAYAFSTSLSLSYNFNPYRGRIVLPIARIIVFDKALRRQIQDSIIEHYSWPNESGNDFSNGEPE